MNQTRKLYSKILNGIKPTDANLGEQVRAADELKSLLEHNGYKRVQRFIETQRLGSNQYAVKETTSINVFSLPWIFNTFVKWLGVQLENRAYNRIETYIKVTIDRGDKAAIQLARAEQKRQEQENARQQ